jgi:hypothetical protein
MCGTRGSRGLSMTTAKEWTVSNARRGYGADVQPVEPEGFSATTWAERAAAEGCACGLTIARWSGRETRALREALRMSVRAFAEHLGVCTASVSGWEHPSMPAPPRLSTQAVLDQALKLADAEARHRFGLLLDSLPGEACTATNHDAGSGAGGSTVTPLHRSGRTRRAS